MFRAVHKLRVAIKNSGLFEKLPGLTSIDILVEPWRDLGTILAKILSRSCHDIRFALVRSQESHFPKKNMFFL